jgi:hypothetical protein
MGHWLFVRSVVVYMRGKRRPKTLLKCPKAWQKRVDSSEIVAVEQKTLPPTFTQPCSLPRNTHARLLSVGISCYHGAAKMQKTRPEIHHSEVGYCSSDGLHRPGRHTGQFAGFRPVTRLMGANRSAYASPLRPAIRAGMRKHAQRSFNRARGTRLRVWRRRVVR